MSGDASAFVSSAPKPGYRPCVGVVLINDRSLVFAATRIDTPGEAWQMPQGGIDGEETPLEAARRELREETGTDKAAFLQESRYWYSYEFPEALRSRVWGGRYPGQTQKWFAFRFTGSDADIDITRHQPREFSDWRWIRLESLPELIVPFKRRVYSAVAEEFGPLLASSP